MKSLRLLPPLLLILGFSTLSFEGAVGQEKKAKQPQLPQNFGKLGLSDEQKTKILKLDADYDAKIADLEAKIKELKSEGKKKMFEVLTPDQQKKYIELVTPGGTTPPEKTPEKK